MKASVYIATSVDGFIAREDGSIDWLPSGENSDGEDYGYHDFMNSVDALVMGRNTFEQVMSFGAWPYGKKPVVVLSSQPLLIPDELSGTVSSMSGSVREIVQQMEERGYQKLYIDGGKTIQEFIREGYIHEIIVTKIPVLIGSGIPLFGSIPEDIHLQHVETTAFENGLVQTRYQVLDNG